MKFRREMSLVEDKVEEAIAVEVANLANLDKGDEVIEFPSFF